MKLALAAGKANPAPPVGPALGAKVSVRLKQRRRLSSMDRMHGLPLHLCIPGTERYAQTGSSQAPPARPAAGGLWAAAAAAPAAVVYTLSIALSSTVNSHRHCTQPRSLCVRPRPVTTHLRCAAPTSPLPAGCQHHAVLQGVQRSHPGQGGGSTGPAAGRRRAFARCVWIVGPAAGCQARMNQLRLPPARV